MCGFPRWLDFEALTREENQLAKGMNELCASDPTVTEDTDCIGNIENGEC